MDLLFMNLGAGEMLVILLFAFVPLILTVVCLVDIVRSDFKDSNTKVLWALIVLLAPLLGSLIYLVMGKTQKAKD